MAILLTHGVLYIILFIDITYGTFRFANYYQSHMVLQRAPQHAIVWGYADNQNVSIKLEIKGKKFYEKYSIYPEDLLDANIWSVTLNPINDEGPYQLVATEVLKNGTQMSIELDDILFGDVWICSGQSNMEFAVSRMFNASTEIANAEKYPKIRLFTAMRRQSLMPQEELLGISLNWSVASAKSVASPYTSAVCWLYGRMVHDELKDQPPMGLIHTSWGGTAIEFWSPPGVLRNCNISNNNEIKLKDSTDNDVTLNIVLNNSVLYNAMIYPFTRMTIKGAIWYQGETNANYNCNKYQCTFLNMIQYWRNIWNTRTKHANDPMFPFGFVQLSTREKTGQVIGGFPWIRWHQTFDIGHTPNNKIPNIFMATAMDLRDDDGGIHPRTKFDVGYRLSRAGLAIAYGQKQIPYQGPVVSEVARDSADVVNVTYSSIYSWTIELRNSNGFEICCEEKQVCMTNETVWLAVSASYEQRSPITIKLAVPSVCRLKQFHGLRYLWRETPCLFKQAAVYSTADSNLPAPPYIIYL